MLARLSTRNWRLVLATALVVSAVALAGCTSETYTTSVGEPTTGDVIENVSFGEINGFDGARFELAYAIDERDNRTYSLRIYEFENGTLEPEGSRLLDPDRHRTRDDVGVPYGDETERRYRLRVERGENDAVVDAVTVTVRVDDSG